MNNRNRLELWVSRRSVTVQVFIYAIVWIAIIFMLPPLMWLGARWANYWLPLGIW